MLRSYRDGKILNRLQLDPYAAKIYGGSYLHIHRADYHRILVQEAQRLGVQVMLGCTVTGIDFKFKKVYIQNALPFVADALIGADGLKSFCRGALLCEGRQASIPRPTGDLAYRILIDVEEIKSHEQLREFVENPALNYWLGPSGHVVAYLIQNEKLYNIVLICPDKLPEMVNTQKADLQEMRGFFEHWDPRLKSLLELVQETSMWKLLDSEELEEWKHENGRFTLLGDACHATFPYLCVKFLLLA